MAGNSMDLMALPRVASRKTLSSMTPIDVLKISRTSERYRDIIKSIKFNLKLNSYGKNVEVYWGDQCSGTFEIGERKNEEEWRKAVTEITKLFRTSLTILRIETKDFETTWEWINREQKGLKKLEVTVKNRRDSRTMIKTLLENSELTQLEELKFEMKISASFKYDDPFVFENPPKKLWIENSSWFSVQNLIDLKTETLHLGSPKFTNKDINMILKEWMNEEDGRLSNLKSIEMLRCRNGISDNIAFKGFDVERGLVTMNGSSWRLTCGKDFYFDVSNSVRRFRIHKKLFADELGRSRRVRRVRRF